MSSDLFDDAVKITAGGGGLGAGLLFARWAINWLTGRHDRREAMIDTKDAALDERWAKYTRKMEERSEILEARCARLEEEVEDCHRSKRDLENRVARLEGFDHGMGQRRQEEQRAASLDHQIARRLAAD